MEQAIHTLEEKLEVLHQQVNSGDASAAIYQELADKQHEVEALYARWQVLLDKS
jgi:hypothetical protein